MLPAICEKVYGHGGRPTVIAGKESRRSMTDARIRSSRESMPTMRRVPIQPYSFCALAGVPVALPPVEAALNQLEVADVVVRHGGELHIAEPVEQRRVAVAQLAVLRLAPFTILRAMSMFSATDSTGWPRARACVSASARMRGRFQCGAPGWRATAVRPLRRTPAGPSSVIGSPNLRASTGERSDGWGSCCGRFVLVIASSRRAGTSIICSGVGELMNVELAGPRRSHTPELRVIRKRRARSASMAFSLGR